MDVSQFPIHGIMMDAISYFIWDWLELLQTRRCNNSSMKIRIDNLSPAGQLQEVQGQLQSTLCWSSNNSTEIQDTIQLGISDQNNITVTIFWNTIELQYVQYGYTVGLGSTIG